MIASFITATGERRKLEAATITGLFIDTTGMPDDPEVDDPRAEIAIWEHDLQRSLTWREAGELLLEPSKGQTYAPERWAVQVGKPRDSYALNRSIHKVLYPLYVLGGPVIEAVSSP